MKRLAPAAFVGATVLVAAAAHADTWTTLTASPYGCIHVVAFNEQTVLCVQPGTYVNFSRSTDGGDKWTDFKGPMASRPTSSLLLWRDADTGLVVYDVYASPTTELLHKTSDGGKTWTVKSLPTGVTALGVRGGYFKGSLALIAGRKEGATPTGFIARSTDNGDSWAEIKAPADPLFGVAGIDANTMVAVSDTTIWRTTDGGATWSKILSEGISGTGSTIKMVDSKNGYALLGSFHRTTDGGATWTTPTYPKGSSTSAELRAFDFIDDKNGLAAFAFSSPKNYGELSRTIDGATTWTVEPEPADWVYKISSVSMASTKVAYASSFVPGFGKPSVIRAGTPSATIPDAGAPDRSTTDSGVTPDGAPPSDSGSTPASDTGPPSPEAGLGDEGGCNLGAAGSGTGATLAIAAMMMLARRRRSSR